MTRWSVPMLLVAVALSGCRVTPERFFERLDRATARAVERCGGPTARFDEDRDPWRGDLLCTAFDPGAARQCLTAYRGLRDDDCVDPIAQPGAHRPPSACDLDIVCGAPPEGAAGADTDGP